MNPIEISTDTAIPLSEAARHIPGRPHISTIWRWTLRKQNPLRVFRVGGRTFTTAAAIDEFIVGCNDGGTRAVAMPTHQRRIEKAEAELERAGI